jgi:predicted enzyme related to lactoylglutathione lyase
MAQPSVQGSFVWQELNTADTAAAGAFYPKVLGWRIQTSPHSASYSMFATASGPVAGMMRLPDDARQMGARPHWLPYIGADDVDGTVGSAERLGAKVLHAASDIANNIGRFAVLSDPQGAAFGVYRPGQAMPAAPKGTPTAGSFSWQELATTDSEAAFEFYSKLFGWQAMQRMDMGPAGSYLIFGRDGVQRGGIYKLSAHTPVPYWLSYVEVGGADAVAASAREAGARVVNGPMDVPGGRIVQMMDPGGVMFAVHSTTKAQAPRPSPEKKPAPAAESAAASKAPAARPSHRPEGEPARAAVAAAPKTAAAAASGASSASSKPAAAAAPAAARAAKPAAARKRAVSRPKAATKKTARKAAGKRAAAKKRASAKKKSGAGKRRARRAAGGARRRVARAKSAARSAGRAGKKRAARRGRTSARGRRGRRR